MDWIIGDIHGCIEELNQLLEKLPPDDKLVFLGDYVDRGPHSSEVIERVLKEKDRSVYLMGNHEFMLKDFFSNEEKPDESVWTYWANGGLETLRSYGIDKSLDFKTIPEEHQTFFKNLKNFHESDYYIAVHAGVRAEGNLNLAEQELDDLLWIRLDWIGQEHLWTGKKVFYGHTPTRFFHGSREEHRPIYGDKSMGVDTGCVYGGYLTAVNPISGELIQIRAKKEYMNFQS